ncbi:hypothetical protein JCM33374_g3704 [Metschnikowia sp. JCM 33374]|nr:hypothetical protein JCM33374_g3704 [Metschnikowia sp. JCM 33374]
MGLDQFPAPPQVVHLADVAFEVMGAFHSFVNGHVSNIQNGHAYAHVPQPAHQFLTQTGTSAGHNSKVAPGLQPVTNKLFGQIVKQLICSSPQVLRIKRKRGQDPLQALILEDSQRSKRSKTSSPLSSNPRTPVPEARSWYFELSGTDDKVAAPDPDVLASVLSEAASARDSRQFIIPKSQTEEDTVIPHELSEMLDSFLTVSDGAAPKRKRRGGKAITGDEDFNGGGGASGDAVSSGHGNDDETQDLVDEYVFDVYKLSSTEPLTNDNYPQSQIGYIRFFDDKEYDLMQSDDENKSRTQIYSDDEDSNAESFYQNDYPEDEDAGEYSDTYEPPLEGDEDDEYDDIGPVIIDTRETAEGHAYLQGHVQADVAENEQFDNLYDEFFDEDGTNTVDFLQQDDDYADEPFERQHFFEGEEDDEMAIHRDRIFGRLQRMINDADT